MESTSKYSPLSHLTALSFSPSLALSVLKNLIPPSGENFSRIWANVCEFYNEIPVAFNYAPKAFPCQKSPSLRFTGILHYTSVWLSESEWIIVQLSSYFARKCFTYSLQLNCSGVARYLNCWYPPNNNFVQMYLTDGRRRGWLHIAHDRLSRIRFSDRLLVCLCVCQSVWTWRT